MGKPELIGSTSSLKEEMEDIALAIAKRHKLIDDDGTIVCRNCKERPGLIPSLFCAPCLAGHYRREGIVQPWCVNRPQTEADKAKARAVI